LAWERESTNGSTLSPGLILQQGSCSDSFSPRAANEETEENDVQGAKIAGFPTMATMWINDESGGLCQAKKGVVWNRVRRRPDGHLRTTQSPETLSESLIYVINA
jgi:hypothetical protein